MKFERLKKSYKKEIIMGAIAICIMGGALTFATTKAKYKLTQSIDLVKGTINYKPYDFKIMAMYKSDDGTNYTEINIMPLSGYVINEEKTYCTTDNKTEVKGKAYTNNSGELVFKNLAKSDKCYLYFDKEKTASETILGNITYKTASPDFSKAATTDEGIYAVSDGMYGGTSYYWRGAVTNNYVKFANFCWRIVRINGDGTLRLIYDGATCHANGVSTDESIILFYAYNTSASKSNYVGWTYTGSIQRPTNNANGTASSAKTQTDSWLKTNITGTNLSKVVDGKYCNDRNVDFPPSSWGGSSEYSINWSITGTKFAYAAAKRLNVDYSPTLSCSNGDLYTLKIGLITADEIEFAGGKAENNTSYYLYNGQFYWSMTPYNWTNSNTAVFLINPAGFLGGYMVNDNTTGLRPVINLVSDITFEPNGDGTIDNPYVVK